MARVSFKGEKRKKELMRQKKQEEKRLRRFKKDAAAGEKDEAMPLEEAETGAEPSEDAAVS